MRIYVKSGKSEITYEEATELTKYPKITEAKSHDIIIEVIKVMANEVKKLDNKKGTC